MGRKYSKRKNKRLFIQANLLERKRERCYREARQEGVDPIILDPDEVEEPKEEPKEEEPKKKPQPQSKVVKHLRSRFPKRSEKYKNYSEPEWRKLIEEGKTKTNKTDDSIIPLNALDEEEFRYFIDYHLATCERADLLGASGHLVDILHKE